MSSALGPVAVVGPGRVGGSLAEALRQGGVEVVGPLGRGEVVPTDVDVLLLCVPDRAVETAAAAVAPRHGLLVGHVSGATGLAPLAPHEAFSLHPLTTVATPATPLRGVPAAVAGSTGRATAVAAALATAAGMSPLAVPEPDRVAYHAAATVAANYLMPVLDLAERLLAGPGLGRPALLPLLHQGVDSWGERGARTALTGPLARGDAATVAAHRQVVQQRVPAELELLDALVAATTRLLTREPPPPPSAPPGGLRLVRTVAELRQGLAPARRAGRRIALVPTMGALHEGHLALVRAAAATATEVVVSLFVNPTQFDRPDDLAGYPRDEARDAELVAAAGAGWLWAPPVAEVYPDGFATTVSVGGVSEPLEGAFRGPAHFDGVAQVVTKLFGAVGPDVAWFGQKDAQQVAVVRRLVADLQLPVEIATVPTVREPDGLARSSRNARLDPTARAQAVALHRGLLAVTATVAAGEQHAERALAAGRAVMAAHHVAPEYLAVVDPDSFETVERVGERGLLVVVAAWVGGVRLIDNLALPPQQG